MHSDGRVAAESVILQELATEPVAVAELKKRVCSRVHGLKSEPYKSALDALLAARMVHGQASITKSGKPGKVSRYALGAPPPPPPPPRELAPKEVLKALSGGPKAPNTLKEEVKRHLPGLPAGDYAATLVDLVTAGSIHARHKRNKNGSPGKAVESYALGGPPPDPFIEPVLALWVKMRSAGIAAGVKDATLVTALVDALRRNGVAVSGSGGERSSGTDGELIMRGVQQLLEREGRGALIPIRKLRVAAALSKDRFDTAVLELYHTDQVILHHHDNVGNMSEAERNELVVDQYGNHYVGLALPGGQ
jgi:hypothetical protein